MDNASVFTEAEEEIKDYAEKFKALSQPLRIKLLLVLEQEEKIGVCNLEEIMGMSQSKLSYHLKILLEVGLIKKTEEGTWSYYQPNEEVIGQLLSRECCSFVLNGRPTEDGG